MADVMWSQFLTHRPILRHSNGPFRRSPMGVVLHVNADPSGTPWSFYNAEPPDNPATVTPTAQFQQDGTGFQCLPYNYGPWCQADGNAWGLAFECQGTPGEPMSAAMVESLARAYAEAHLAVGVPLQVTDTLSRGGLGTHAMGGASWGGHTSCPGAIRSAQRFTIIQRAIEIVGGVDVVTEADVDRIATATAQKTAAWFQKYIPAELGGSINRIVQILGLEGEEAANIMEIKSKLIDAGHTGDIDVHALAVEFANVAGTALAQVK